MLSICGGSALTAGTGAAGTSVPYTLRAELPVILPEFFRPVSMRLLFKKWPGAKAPSPESP